jgi:hypothetical protein
MRILTIFGFLLVCVSLAWLGLNQQETNTHLRALVAENRKLTDTLAKQGAALEAAQAAAQSRAVEARPFSNRNLGGRLSLTRPSGLSPGGNRLTAQPQDPDPNAGSLSSHSADGRLFQRSWGPEQLVGPPNTLDAGDQTTAWAQYTSNGGDEWLQVTFEKSVDIAEVIVRETYNPGTVAKVAAVLPNGQETAIWEGTEPAIQAPVDMSFPTTQKVNANTIKVYLDRRRARGWNEIDAVELVGRDGSRQWAASATVSSAYSISPGNTVPSRQDAQIEFDTLDRLDTLRR